MYLLEQVGEELEQLRVRLRLLRHQNFLLFRFLFPAEAARSLFLRAAGWARDLPGSWLPLISLHEREKKNIKKGREVSPIRTRFGVIRSDPRPNFTNGPAVRSFVAFLPLWAVTALLAAQREGVHTDFF